MGDAVILEKCSLPQLSSVVFSLLKRFFFPDTELLRPRISVFYGFLYLS